MYMEALELVMLIRTSVTKQDAFECGVGILHYL